MSIKYRSRIFRKPVHWSQERYLEFIKKNNLIVESIAEETFEMYQNIMSPLGMCQEVEKATRKECLLKFCDDLDEIFLSANGFKDACDKINRYQKEEINEELKELGE